MRPNEPTNFWVAQINLFAVCACKTWPKASFRWPILSDQTSTHLILAMRWFLFSHVFLIICSSMGYTRELEEYNCRSDLFFDLRESRNRAKLLFQCWRNNTWKRGCGWTMPRWCFVNANANFNSYQRHTFFVLGNQPSLHDRVEWMPTVLTSHMFFCIKPKLEVH